MRVSERRIAGWGRVATLAGYVAGAVVGVVVLAILPNLGWLLPATVRKYPVEWLAATSTAAYGIARASSSARARRAVEVVELGADRLLGGWLAAAGGVVAVVLVAGWLPQYLTWPWWRDTDTFATIAQSWDHGVRPYRDILAYNFPGHTYLHWTLGKLFGWGRVSLFYFLDAAGLILLGAALVGWSRRRLGGAVPGLVGYVAYLWYYLGFAFDMVAQRDYHAALGTALALLAVQGLPGRRGRIASALAMAVALTIRPQAVLFTPALAAAVVQEAYRAGRGWRGGVRDLAEWSATVGLFVIVGFAPLFLSGLMGDFVRSLRFASYGGPYSQATPSTMIATFVDPFGERWADLALGATLLSAILAPLGVRRLAWPWALACAGATFYAPLSPVHHDYLRHPLFLLMSVSLAFPAAWLLAARGLAAPVRVLAVVLLAYESSPTIPRFWLPLDSARALLTLARGEASATIPEGCAQPFKNLESDHLPGWRDYARLLDYLRGATGPRTLVANLLNRSPWEALNGPAGRMSPFRCESGICWMDWVAIDLDGTFADALEASTDSVVVWQSDQQVVSPRLTLERTVAVARRLYRPGARFGAYEVWRRKEAP